MRFSDEQLVSLTRNTSESENIERVNALRVVVDVLNRAGFDFAVRHDIDSGIIINHSHQYSLLVEGSFGNDTALGESSDLDIDFIDEVFNYDESGDADYILNLLDAYKNIDRLNKSILNAFKKARYKVVEGNQCLNITINNINIDIVPSIRHITRNGVPGISYTDKTRGLVNNYPEVNIINAFEKNRRTSNRYQQVVRSLKRIKKMFEAANGLNGISSYSFESLIYNIDDRVFAMGNLASAIKACLSELGNYDVVIINSLMEINEINRITYNPNNTPRNIYTFLQDFLRYIGY